MPARLYDSYAHKASGRAADELAEALQKIERHLRKIADAETRRAIVRECRIITGHDRRGGDREPGRPS